MGFGSGGTDGIFGVGGSAIASFVAGPSKSLAPTDVWCPEGFRCVSQISEFGLGHDGTFKQDQAKDIPSDPLIGEAYEWGCPARGAMSKGACVDDGKGGENMCWSTRRFEMGPGTPCGASGDTRCRCIRPFASNGSGSARSLSIIRKGEEVLDGKFLESSPLACDNCSSLSENEQSCNACYPGCAMVSPNDGAADVSATPKCMPTANLPITSTGGPPDADTKRGRIWNHAADPKEERIKIVPHYRLWSPEEPEKSAGPGSSAMDAEEDGDGAGDGEEPSLSTIKWPYLTSRKEPLSRRAWIAAYREAAPRMQHAMDMLATNIKERAKNAESSSCWTATDPGGDINGKLDKFLVVQRTCRDMRDTADTVRGVGAKLDVGFDSADCGRARAGSCGCNRQAIAGRSSQFDCKSLNCYSEDQAVDKAVKALQDKNSSCLTKAKAKVGDCGVAGAALCLSGGSEPRARGLLTAQRPRRTRLPPWRRSAAFMDFLRAPVSTCRKIRASPVY
eukprot:TRINITY_DN56822_c0_g1_i1.p1 TRINITY_DN56822_c0_g1~~TRINITY_DN56822_c0_g1_i1.p1  ORF type:complete len:505 (+),score=74.53 TRINITY_DN56822_c0_g1_i1:67-1581(+)